MDGVIGGNLLAGDFSRKHFGHGRKNNNWFIRYRGWQEISLQGRMDQYLIENLVLLTNFKKLINFIGMKYVFGPIFLFLSLSLAGQPLRDINYNYLYNPGELTNLELKAVRYPDRWTIFYKLQLRDTSYRIDDFSIQWESRENLSIKDNIPISPADIKEIKREASVIIGKMDIQLEGAPKILAAKVVNKAAKRAWFFYKVLELEYPVTTYLLDNSEIPFRPYVNLSNKVTIADGGNWTVSYYEDNFPTASPPFSEAQGRVNRSMKTDSTLHIEAGEEINLPLKGLYLVQKDTNSAEGLSFRVEDDYPRLGRIQSLAGPLVYICTKLEYDRLVLAKGDKKAFDRVILGITTDTDRARKFMRSYFRRVELANQYFTSYKEGWKTDRGMIYIIFGLPDEVFKFSDREVWNYKNDLYNVTFNFSKANTVFDPDNYVLIRDKKYQQTWYEVIDLWRNARF